MMKTLEQIFNWKKYPAGVFFSAIPLVLIQVALLTTIAVVHWIKDKDPVYAVILVVGAVVAWVVLFPMFRLYRQTQKNFLSRGE